MKHRLSRYLGLADHLMRSWGIDQDIEGQWQECDASIGLELYPAYMMVERHTLLFISPDLIAWNWWVTDRTGDKELARGAAIDSDTAAKRARDAAVESLKFGIDTLAHMPLPTRDNTVVPAGKKSWAERLKESGDA